MELTTWLSLRPYMDSRWLNRLLCYYRARSHWFYSLPCILLFAWIVTYQFQAGWLYKSNDTTNSYLRLARATSWAILPVMTLLWLPMLRTTIAGLRSSVLGKWLPIHCLKGVHRWLGWLFLLLAMIHASQYLLYYTTLSRPFTEVVSGQQADLVRAMHTTMYEAVSEDEDIVLVEQWIATGASETQFHTNIRPILKADCTKCHSVSSTMSYARPDLPLADYEQVLPWIKAGVASKQFRINVSGIGMVILLVLLGLFALPYMRKHFYHLFQLSHHLGYLTILLSLLHIPSLLWITGPVLVLAVDMIAARYLLRRDALSARLSRFSDDVVHLEIDVPAILAHRPGHYVQICIPALDLHEWHPFSLTGEGSDQQCLTLKILCQGDWTKRLWQLSSQAETRSLMVNVRGPYASSSAKALSCKGWLLVAGGVGVTPFLGLLASVLSGQVKPIIITFVWVVRDVRLLQWILPWIKYLSDTMAVTIHWHLYITASAETMAGDDGFPSRLDLNNVTVRYGRPEWSHLAAHISWKNTVPACFVCGPRELTRQATAVCRERGWRVWAELF